MNKISCPHCDELIQSFVMEEEGFIVNCPHCKKKIDIENSLSNSTVNVLAQLLPELYRDNYLQRLGFEKQRVSWGPKAAFYLFTILFIFILPIVLFIEDKPIFFRLSFIFANALWIYALFRYYKREQIPKYKKSPNKGFNQKC